VAREDLTETPEEPHRGPSGIRRPYGSGIVATICCWLLPRFVPPS
jgi:hypothetical protein